MTRHAIARTGGLSLPEALRREASTDGNEPKKATKIDKGIVVAAAETPILLILLL
jgi:hypothetical protein